MLPLEYLLTGHARPERTCGQARPGGQSCGAILSHPAGPTRASRRGPLAAKAADTAGSGTTWEGDLDNWGRFRVAASRHGRGRRHIGHGSIGSWPHESCFEFAGRGGGPVGGCFPRTDHHGRWSGNTYDDLAPEPTCSTPTPRRKGSAIRRTPFESGAAPKASASCVEGGGS